MSSLLNRLRGEPQHLERLVSLVVQDLLNRPVRDLVDPGWIGPRFVEGFRASVSEQQTEAWVRAQVQEALDRAQREEGSLRGRIPEELVAPIRQLATRPYQPDRLLLRAILDHEAMHKLLRQVLMETLTDFGRSLKTVTQGPPAGAKRRGTFGSLMGAAQEMASAVGGVMEKQVEGKVREFVDGAIDRSLDLTVEKICAEDFVPDFAQWRGGILDNLLAVDVEKYLDEVEKLDPDGLVTELAAILRGLAAWEGLGEQVESLLQAVVDEAGDKRLSDFLEGSGLEEDWRPQLEALFVVRAREFVETPAFAQWLADVEG